MTPAEALLAAIQKRGSDARNLRDAAHEACHAIQSGLKGRWHRDKIHNKLVRGRRAGELVLIEIQARAVEQLVCADLGVDPGTVEQWAEITWWETIKNMKINLPSVEWIAERVRNHMSDKRVRRLADQVILLG